MCSFGFVLCRPHELSKTQSAAVDRIESASRAHSTGTLYQLCFDCTMYTSGTIIISHSAICPAIRENATFSNICSRSFRNNIFIIVSSFSLFLFRYRYPVINVVRNNNQKRQKQNCLISIAALILRIHVTHSRQNTHTLSFAGKSNFRRSHTNKYTNSVLTLWLQCQSTPYTGRREMNGRKVPSIEKC